MKQQDVFASTQIIKFNPILKESDEIQTNYFLYLRNLIRLVKWNKRKYTKAQLAFYKDILYKKQELNHHKNSRFPARFCYLIPYDLSLMVAYHNKVFHTDKITMILNKIAEDFHLNDSSREFLCKEFNAALGNQEAWNEVLNNKNVKGFNRYLKLVRDNIFFIKERPYNILITATMSAGKSTLINSLIGKNISLMQNMACTSKIHTIISKSFEDGVTSEYDHDLSMDASKNDLLSDNIDNLSKKITVGTYFNSIFNGKRIVLFDSPGVNSSVNIEHTEITQKMLSSRRYNLLVYVINATQLATTDEEKHLEYVKQQIGNRKVIFVMNKIDHLLSDEDNVFDIIERQRCFLKSKGFKNPIVCPISSRAAYLIKKSKIEELNRIELREIENLIDKFERISLKEYYEKHFCCSSGIQSYDEINKLYENCGFAYLEKIIDYLSNGGKFNGTDLC